MRSQKKHSAKPAQLVPFTTAFDPAWYRRMAFQERDPLTLAAAIVRLCDINDLLQRALYDDDGDQKEVPPASA